ncbi:perlucin-like protein [Mytilus edulis]|uniref:perlucin-like protein n=1 Tax=Mytilus edulis TaxID=6550 RepID=UPI0039EFFB64
MYKCMKGMKISGKPFAVCRETGKWKPIFICEIQCETGWIVFGGHCYYIGPDKKTLEDSETDCQRKGSHLVKIEDASENLWLQNVMIEKNIDKLRIGAHDIVQEGTWRWIYDDTFVDFTNWGNNQPNNYRNQDCAELLKSFSYRWNDVSCTSLLQYVCEK